MEGESTVNCNMQGLISSEHSCVRLVGQLDPCGVDWRRSAGAFVDNTDG